MEIGQLYKGIYFLCYTAGCMLILVTIMLLKIGYDFDKLTKNLNSTLNIVKEELTPTLKNVNKSVEIVSGIIIKADNSVNKIKTFIANSPLKVLSKLSTLSGTVAKGFFGGLCAGLKIFGKKK